MLPELDGTICVGLPGGFLVCLVGSEAPLIPIISWCVKRPPLCQNRCLRSIWGFRKKFTELPGIAQYYTELDYDTFADQWRRQLTALLEEYPLELTSYQLNRIEIPDEEVHLYFLQNRILGDGMGGHPERTTYLVTFRVEENRWASLENIQPVGGSVTPELESGEPADPAFWSRIRSTNVGTAVKAAVPPFADVAFLA